MEPFSVAALGFMAVYLVYSMLRKASARGDDWPFGDVADVQPQHHRASQYLRSAYDQTCFVCQDTNDLPAELGLELPPGAAL